MSDHFHALWALHVVVRGVRASIVVASLLMLLAVDGACIGVSAKPAAGVGPGAPAAVKRCRAVRPADDGAVDDLEDGNNQITKSSGRDGYWWSAADPKGSKIEMQATEPGAGGSEMSMRMTGTTVPGKPEDDSWGVQLGVNFVSQGMFYDASKYSGIAFKAKAAPESTRKARFKIADINTHKDAGVCKACWNHFRKDFNLTTEWKEYRMMFTELAQRPGWGDPRPAHVTATQVLSVSFALGGVESDFDIWIDDIQFLECKK